MKDDIAELIERVRRHDPDAAVALADMVEVALAGSTAGNIASGAPLVNLWRWVALAALVRLLVARYLEIRSDQPRRRWQRPFRRPQARLRHLLAWMRIMVARL